MTDENTTYTISSLPVRHNRGKPCDEPCCAGWPADWPDDWPETGEDQ